MLEIITLGSATIDLFLRFENLKTKKIKEDGAWENYLKLTEKVPIKTLFNSPGGGATNTAATFSNLGFAVKIICAIGQDNNGRLIQRNLVAKKIKTSQIQVISKEKTGFSVILSTGQADRTIFVYRGANLKIDHRQVKWRNLSGDLIYITSLGGNLKMASRAILTAKQKGMKIAWNPGGQEINQGLEGLSALLRHVDFLFLNQKEAQRISGGSLLAEVRTIEKIKSYVKGLVVITNGEKGARAFNGKEMIYKKAAKAQTVIDATGAGDAFGSGFAGTMLKTGNDLEAAFDFALKNSSKVIGELGAQKGLIKNNG